MTDRWLIDTSFLISFFDRTQQSHKACVDAIADHTDYLIPEVVLTEAAYMLRKFSGDTAYLVFLRWLPIVSHRLVTLTEPDLNRVRAISQRYAQFDFVDCCLMAIAERNEITTICTLDRRDFRVYQPTHCEYFRLIPEK